MKILQIVLLLAAFIFGLAAPGAAAGGPEGLNAETLPEWKVTNQSRGVKLLLSDSPEMVTADGILYQDKVEGVARLFYYHVNAAAGARRMEVVLENTGPEPAHVTVRKFGLGGPGYDWMAVGKEALTDYLGSSKTSRLTVPPRGTSLLSEDIGKMAVLPNMLVNGIFDFYVDRPVTLKVMMLPMLADVAEFSRSAKVLPWDECHLRGTFPGANRRLVPQAIYDPDRDGTVAITLADNETDRYLEGVDATDGSKVVDFGNYGVVYQIFLPSKNSGKISCYLAPLGGDYAGAVGIKYRQEEQGPVATPQGQTSFGGNRAPEFSFLGLFDSHQSLWLTFSPPGASNLPVRLVIQPQ